MLFRSPVGTEEECSSGKIWPGDWYDATPYLTHYEYGIHPGADLNLPRDTDRLASVFAIGDGIVSYAQRWPNPKYWGNIIVIDHGIVDGQALFSRYAHVANIKVSVDQLVTMGQQIAQVGDGFGLFPYHLHFDISTTDLLFTEPNNWPSPKATPNEAFLKQHYVDPRAWLMRPHVVGRSPGSGTGVKVARPAAPAVLFWFVIDPAGAIVRKEPGIASAEVGVLPRGAKLTIDGQGGNQDGYTWGRITGGEFAGCWLAIRKQDQSKSYVSTNPPQ
jgi:murein DD-endopeptidase MepM/ murein hydrolase activator NlpD